VQQRVLATLVVVSVNQSVASGTAAIAPDGGCFSCACWVIVAIVYCDDVVACCGSDDFTRMEGIRMTIMEKLRQDLADKRATDPEV
jgi:hypothetical protein